MIFLETIKGKNEPETVAFLRIYSAEIDGHSVQNIFYSSYYRTSHGSNQDISFMNNNKLLYSLNY